jgi:hypothetical protein
MAIVPACAEPSRPVATDEDVPVSHKPVINPKAVMALPESAGSDNSPVDPCPDERSLPLHLFVCQPEQATHRHQPSVQASKPFGTASLNPINQSGP